MTTEIIGLENIWVSYEDVVALEDINFCIYQNEFIGIIGPNGGGKTTLLKVILGLVQSSQGKIRVFGTIPEKGRKFIGYVPQRTFFDRDFPISVWDVVLMGRLGQRGAFRGYSNKDKKIAFEALKTVEMIDFKDRQIGKLSGGQRQRIYIARALATEPKLLILDEPMASIDKPMETEFYELLKKLKERMAIILVSHDIGTISIYVDKIACLNRQIFYHDSKEITIKDLSKIYKCPVEIIAHGIPHRVLKEH